MSADTWRFIVDRDWIDQALPQIARPSAHGRWLHEYIRGFDRLADRVVSGDTEMLARCTVEELALHEVINLPRPTWATPFSTSTSPPPYPTTAIRTATSTMRELLFEDHDVLMLVNPGAQRHQRLRHQR